MATSDREHLDGLFRAIRAVVRRIPRGHVATYGQVAELAGIPGGGRVAGAAMKTSTPADRLPWQRVLGKAGRARARIAIHDPVGAAVQRGLLEDEGVEVGDSGLVRLDLHGWLPAPAQVAGRSAKLAGHSAQLAGRSAQLAGRSAKLARSLAKLAGPSAKLAGRSAQVAGRSAKLARRSAKLARPSTKLVGRSAKLAERPANVATAGSSRAASPRRPPRSSSKRRASPSRR